MMKRWWCGGGGADGGGLCGHAGPNETPANVEHFAVLIIYIL